MSNYGEQEIFHYLDQEMTPEQTKAFELALKNDPELKSALEAAQKSHQYFNQNNLEKAPEVLTDQVIQKITASSNKKYYRHYGLFSSTTFLLISGVLTALVAFLSLISSDYIDWSAVSPGIPEGSMSYTDNLFRGFVSRKVINSSMLVIYGILALVLLDRFVLNPLFRGKMKQLGYH